MIRTGFRGSSVLLRMVLPRRVSTSSRTLHKWSSVFAQDAEYRCQWIRRRGTELPGPPDVSAARLIRQPGCRVELVEGHRSHRDMARFVEASVAEPAAQVGGLVGATAGRQVEEEGDAGVFHGVPLRAGEKGRHGEQPAGAQRVAQPLDQTCRLLVVEVLYEVEAEHDVVGAAEIAGERVADDVGDPVGHPGGGDDVPAARSAAGQVEHGGPSAW